ncbi:MAG: hypothetical protein AAF533_04445 [Acidobacteriota bacterium]
MLHRLSNAAFLSRRLGLGLFFSSLALGGAEAAGTGAITAGGTGIEGALRLIHQEGDQLTFVGRTESADVGNTDLWWADFTVEGELLREGLLGGPGLDLPSGALVTSSGRLVTVSIVFGDPAPGRQGVLIACYGEDRTLHWARAYEADTAVGGVNGVLELPDGDLLLYGGVPPWILRLSSVDGDLVSAAVFDITGLMAFLAAALAPDGGLLLAGQWEGAGDDIDGWLTRLDATLTPTWQVRYGGSSSDSLADLVARPGGGWLAVGNTFSFAPGSMNDVWALALDDDGNVEWQRKYGGSGFDQTPSLATTSDGSFVVSALTQSWGAGLFDAWLFALEADGSLRWQRSFGGPLSELESHVSVLNDGRLVLGLASTSPSDGRSIDAWSFWLDSDGSITDDCMVSTTTDAVPQATDAARVDTAVTMEALSFTEFTPDLTETTWSSNPIVQCWEVVPDPPDEVSAPGAVVPLRVGSDFLITWEPAAISGADTFDVYRGSLGAWPTADSATCLVSELVVSSTIDLDEPGPGAGWYYLVGGVNAAGAGPLGNDSLDESRGISMSCP